MAVIKNNKDNLSEFKCLDVGCSSGIVTNFLATEFREVVGIDVDESAISNASKNFKKKNLKFFKMAGEKIGFPSNSFDVAIANQIYEFVKNPEETMFEINRVLKPGGICFFGARNKLALIEAQYNLPFLSMLPKPWADFIIRLSGKGRSFIGNYKNYWELRKLVKNFEIHDYTLKIMKNPQKFSFVSLYKYAFILKIIPLKFFTPFLPNYIWILRKRS